MSDAVPLYSVVIPIYNEAPCLRELHARLAAVMDRLEGGYEVLLVDDGSRDGSAELIDSLAAADPRLRAIHFTRNFGQHPAVYAGFDHARGRIIITLDGDLQNPPEEIPKLLAKLAEGYDMVTGVRLRRHDSPLRTIPSRIVNWMIGKLTRVPLRDYGCLLRVYRRQAVAMLRRCREQTVYFTALISWLGVRIAEVEVAHAPRGAGRSKYNWWKLITMNFDLITGYSILPIQLISVGGLFVAALGFLCSLIFLVLELAAPQGHHAFGLVMSAAFFMLGLLLVALGFIGEYIGRILIEVKGRPFYLLREELDAEDPSR